MKKLLLLLLASSLLLTFTACEEDEEAPSRGTDPFNYFIDYQSPIFANKFSSPVKNKSDRYSYISVKTFDNPAISTSTYRSVSSIVKSETGQDDITYTYNSDGLLSKRKADRQETTFTFSDSFAFEISSGGTGSYNENFMLTALNFEDTEYDEDITNNYTYDDKNRITKQVQKRTFGSDSDEYTYEYSYQDGFLKEYKQTNIDADGTNVKEERVYDFARVEKRPIKCTITEETGTSTIEYEYNDEGYVSKATLSGTDLDQTEEYTWSENGFLDKVVYKDNKESTSVTYDYTYDQGILLSIDKDSSEYITYEISEK
ncbi:MAG: hypothetical protein PF637_12570 [Spirochaetes bacterium]|jgi:hypothetical protein|nr:hypothetical protein [Spirochaetota bacterium]